MNLPEKPAESDCCGSGCSPCIFDIYQQHLDRYQKLNATQITDADPNTSDNCILQTKYSLFRLTNVKYESLNTYLYTFTYVQANSSAENHLRLRYWPGQHFLLRGTDGNNHFTRAYTPLGTKSDNHLSFTVLIKLYSDGMMSNFLRNLTKDSETLWRGPYGNYNLNFGLKNMLMICQGTGIAPIHAIINQIIDNEACETLLQLFYCCRNSQCIHLRTDIHSFSSYWNFKYELYLSEVADEHFRVKYKEKVHFRKLQQTDVRAYLETVNCDSGFQVLICGSDSFCNDIKDCVKNYGVNENCLHVF